jgi:predicted RNA binding protein with dsRBD fold (UPF0201 family)
VSLPEFRAKLVLEATISPSEDQLKVTLAMKNVIGEAECNVTVSPGSARVDTDDPRALVRIRDQLRDRHVRAAARKQMLLTLEESTTSLMFNRQAAAAGVVALCGSPEESPLGPIYLNIESDRVDAVIDWLASYPG